MVILASKIIKLHILGGFVGEFSINAVLKELESIKESEANEWCNIDKVISSNVVGHFDYVVFSVKGYSHDRIPESHIKVILDAGAENSYSLVHIGNVTYDVMWSIVQE